MELLLLRHADAIDYAESDLARPLSEKGHRQSLQVAQHLLTSEPKPSLILSSSALRTMETAQAVAEALKLKVHPCDWAQPGMQPLEALRELKAYGDFTCVLLVGHQPDISFLAAKLLGNSHSEPLHISKASLLHLHLSSFDSAEFRSFLPCRLT